MNGKIDLNDLIGKKFNKLTIIEAVREKRGKDTCRQIYVTCQCDCGNIHTCRYSTLVNNTVQSCGCLKQINLDNLIGQKFNKLTIVKAVREKRKEDSSKQIYVTCKCECGSVKEYKFSALKCNRIKSCGCIRQSLTEKFNNRLYNIWYSMKRRCYNENDKDYIRYGQKNIKICDEWLQDYHNFEKWALKNGYDDNLIIGRINTSGNYEPDNCHWTTIKEQNNNTKSNYYITINNETKTLAQWCEFYNIKYEIVQARLNNLHWQPLQALTTPINFKNANNADKQTKLQAIWKSMKRRCYNENYIHYKYWGGRGIRVCDEWLNSFESFYNWAINNGYEEGLSIDRINNNGNYEPNNCRWTTMKVQANNTSRNHYITINNETKTMKQWCEFYDIVKYSTVKNRIDRFHWDPIKALTTLLKK